MSGLVEKHERIPTSDQPSGRKGELFPGASPAAAATDPNRDAVKRNRTLIIDWLIILEAARKHGGWQA